MAIHHLLRRYTPDLERRWIVGLFLLLAILLAGSFIRWGGPPPPLELVVLGPDGRFRDSVAIPPEWSDAETTTADAVLRAPLILGVRNPGTRPSTPATLTLRLPVRYRLTTTRGEPLEPRIEAGSPLLSYTLRLGFDRVEPQRLPMLLPAHDTLWLEVVVPAYYCISLADSIIEFVPAPPPPLESLSSLRLFYSFEGGDLDGRQTGTLTIGLDTTLMRRPGPPAMPSYPMDRDPALAMPDLGQLGYVGSRRSQCGEPEDPMELLSTVWETQAGGRFITLDLGGRVRKHLFDLDGDGTLDRESWDPSGDGRFDATRRMSMPIPEFLLPREPKRFDMARLDTLPPDSLAALDPFRRAMPAPGSLPDARRRLAVDTVAPEPEPEPEPEPPPPPRPRGPLGRPIPDGTSR